MKNCGLKKCTERIRPPQMQGPSIHHIRKPAGHGKKTIRKLRPRYRFALNPFSYMRWSKCPKCSRITYMRKFLCSSTWMDRPS